MDEMKVKLSTKFMRNLVSKLISDAISKKLGCKMNIQLNALDASIVDGETKISTNVEATLNKEGFIKLMESIS